jgi:hypothetical protein
LCSYVHMCRAHPVLRRKLEWRSVHTYFHNLFWERGCVYVCECFKISVFPVPSHEMESVCVYVCLCVHESLNYINEKYHVTHVKYTKSVFYQKLILIPYQG